MPEEDPIPAMLQLIKELQDGQKAITDKINAISTREDDGNGTGGEEPLQSRSKQDPDAGEKSEENPPAPSMEDQEGDQEVLEAYKEVLAQKFGYKNFKGIETLADARKLGAFLEENKANVKSMSEMNEAAKGKDGPTEKDPVMTTDISAIEAQTRG